MYIVLVLLDGLGFYISIVDFWGGSQRCASPFFYVKFFMKSSVFNEHVLKGLKRSTSFRKKFGGFRKM